MMTCLAPARRPAGLTMSSRAWLARAKRISGVVRWVVVGGAARASVPISVRGTAGAALALSLASLATPFAHAARPLTTDDADVLDANACEWDTYGANLRSPDNARQTAWQTQVGCGLGHRAQLSLSGGSSGQGSDRRRVVGIGGKFGLSEEAVEGDESWQFATSFSVNMLSLNDAGFEIQDNSLTLVASRPFAGSWMGHVNLGWSYSKPSHASRTTWNLALENALGSDVAVMGEVFGDDRSRAWAGAGARWVPVKNSTVNASFSVQGRRSSTRVLTVGYVLAF